MKEKTKTIFTFKFPYSFPRYSRREVLVYLSPHGRGPRELRGITENLISVFCRWSGTSSTQLCPVGLSVSTSSPGLCFQMLQMCEYVWVPEGGMYTVLLT